MGMGTGVLFKLQGSFRGSERQDIKRKTVMKMEFGKILSVGKLFFNFLKFTLCAVGHIATKCYCFELVRAVKLELKTCQCLHFSCILIWE